MYFDAERRAEGRLVLVQKALLTENHRARTQQSLLSQLSFPDALRSSRIKTYEHILTLHGGAPVLFWYVGGGGGRGGGGGDEQTLQRDGDEAGRPGHAAAPWHDTLRHLNGTTLVWSHLDAYVCACMRARVRTCLSILVWTNLWRTTFIMSTFRLVRTAFLFKF